MLRQIQENSSLKWRNAEKAMTERNAESGPYAGAGYGNQTRYIKKVR